MPKNSFMINPSECIAKGFTQSYSEEVILCKYNHTSTAESSYESSEKVVTEVLQR